MISSKQPICNNKWFNVSLCTNQRLQTDQCWVLLTNPFILFIFFPYTYCSGTYDYCDILEPLGLFISKGKYILQ